MKHIKLPLTRGECDTRTVFDATGREFSVSFGMVHEAQEQAAFIVQACNSYGALLEACKQTLIALDRGRTRTAGPSGFSIYDNDRCRELLREAIAKAEGE